ncbi:MAG: hypothetical protein HLUCCO18_05395 [Rhodobacteraceae bacterium HLUCCO18]|nr:MAG: hypothetical protein HLUCCO18_05395 [Rhodobacteraceae bacterium HLUCCO18]
MFPPGFSFLWTAVCAWFLFATFDELSPLERSVGIGCVLIGLLLMRTTWLRWRRHRSLRVETDGDSTWYVWIEIDGTPRRSACDPRKDWDGDGDGDGGDGGGD